MKILRNLYEFILRLFAFLKAILAEESSVPKLKKLNLRAFDAASDAATRNLTTSAEPGINDLSPTQKTFYSDRLIDLCNAKLFYTQFAQKEPIPEGGGRMIEFRGFEPLAKVTGALTENMTPEGQKLTMKTVNCTVREYGAWVPIGKWLTITSRDKILTQANKLLGDQAGVSIDTLAREVLCSGTNKLFYDGSVTSKASLTNVGSNPMLFNGDVVSAAHLQLELQNAPTFEDNCYVCIAHPVAIADLMHDENWVEAHKYTDAESIYKGEVGKYMGVRFCSTTEAKIERGNDLTAAARNLTVKTTSNGASVAVKESISDKEAEALAGRKVNIGGIVYEVDSATAGNAGSASITLTESVSATADGIIYPGEGGAGGCSVYYSIFLAEGAYGTSEISGNSLEFIIHPAGSSGASDPLDQRGSSGWYATFGCCIIIPQYLVVCMTAGSKDLKSN